MSDRVPFRAEVYLPRKNYTSRMAQSGLQNNPNWRGFTIFGRQGERPLEYIEKIILRFVIYLSPKTRQKHYAQTSFSFRSL